VAKAQAACRLATATFVQTIALLRPDGRYATISRFGSQLGVLMMTEPTVRFDHYFTYAELTEYLQHYASRYPQFADLSSIGKSHCGREVWAMTITNGRTGSAESKPAMYVDGNIHAGEVTGSVACIYLIDYLLSRYDSDPVVRKLLDQRTFYILPRVNPDGAELYLTSPTMLRSSVRSYPDWRQHQDPAGLHVEDINGDGEILLMRVRDDAHGAWKVDSDDDRIMVERTPRDLEGPFYHVFSEGVLRDEFGQLVQGVKWPFAAQPTKYGLDLNRNFPAGYNPLTPGAGPYPLSEPETKNLVEFISQHKNIAGVLLYHTYGGVLFRPHSTIPDKNFPGDDAAMYEKVGKLGTEVTGYPVVCCYGDIWSGVLDDWCYEQLGLYAFTVELWDMVGRAAPEKKANPVRQQTPEERRELELKLLQWNDRELAGQGFVRWQTFDHPQFGSVEIGGWRAKQCRQNPPPQYLQPECHKVTQFVLNYALALPEVHIEQVDVDSLGDGVYALSALVSNRGLLPTNISQMALKQRAVRPDAVRLELPRGASLINCSAEQELGFLEGYAASQKVRFHSFQPPAKTMARANWTVRMPVNSADQQLTILLRSQRGGTVSHTVKLS
jgi:murein tripeptide amidase MpaA